MRSVKFIIMVLAVNIGLFLFNMSDDTVMANMFVDLTNPQTGNAYTTSELANLNNNFDSLENISITQDNNATVTLDTEGGVGIGTIFNTLFLVIDVVGTVVLAQIFTPWTVIAGLGIPSVIALPIGIILLALNILLIIEFIAGR